MSLVPHRDLLAGQTSLFVGHCITVFNVRAPIAKYLFQSFQAANHPEREGAPEHLLVVYPLEELPGTYKRWGLRE